MQFNNLTGEGQVQIDGNRLYNGMYYYNLLVKGVEMVTKKMVVQRN